MDTQASDLQTNNYELWEIKRAVPTLVHASCFHSFLVFSCSISKMYNDNFILATDDTIFDNVLLTIKSNSWLAL